MNDGTIVATIIGSIAAAVVSIYTVRQNTVAKKADTLQGQIKRLDSRVRSLEKRDRIKDDYIAVIRQKYQDETGKAPPPWPADLLALDSDKED